MAIKEDVRRDVQEEGVREPLKGVVVNKMDGAMDGLSQHICVRIFQYSSVVQKT